MVPRFNAGQAYDAVKRINAEHVPGDIVELGVCAYKSRRAHGLSLAAQRTALTSSDIFVVFSGAGGQSCFMALSQRRFSTQPRRLWLFDTFAGMPAPTADDDRRSRWYYRRITNGTAKHAPGGVRDGKWAYAANATVPEHRIHAYTHSNALL